MRYFVIMCDGVVKPAVNVSKCKNSGRTYFDVDGQLYRYQTFGYACRTKWWGTQQLLVPMNSFQQFIHEDWLDTKQIEYLLALDEEENEELNYFQSTDFNAGVIYNQVEKLAVHMISNKHKQVASAEVVLPRIQVILKGCGSVKEMDTLTAMFRCVTEHFDAVYGKSFTLEFGSVYTQNQYFHFPYVITRKTEYKEMTITDIEEALGYKIKVVGEK